MANTVLARMMVVIAGNTAEFTKALNKTNKDLNSFTASIKNIAGTLGVAFGGQQLASFVVDIAKLAGNFEAVDAAFKRLPNSTRLLEDLKKATGGTVSELELMKRAVQANNFEISLKALPRLLEFATLRAQQTGQSVDYLVDSIVTGIGRKSKLILDNLGISAVQLNEALGGASTAASSIGEVADAVGKIAEANLKNMASFSDNAATRIQKLSAEWENLKVAMGGLVNEAGGPQTIGFFTRFIEGWTSMIKGGAQYGNVLRDLNLAMDTFNLSQPHGSDFLDAYKKLEKQAAEAGVKLVLLTDNATGLRKIMIDPRTPMLTGANESGGKLVTTLEVLREKFKELNEQFDTTDENDKKKLISIGKEINALDAQIKKLEELKKAHEFVRGANLTTTQRKKFEAELDPSFKEGFTATGTLVDPNFLKIDVKGIVKNLETLPQQMKPIFLDIQDLFSNLEESAMSVGNIVGGALEGAFSGALSGIQILRRATSEIVDLFARQAIAAAIANAAKAGGPFPFASVVLASAAAAAMRGLLNRSGVKSSVGGGGGSGSFSNATNPNSLFFDSGNRNSTVTLMASGTSLISVTNEQERRNTRIRPNTRRLG